MSPCSHLDRVYPVETVQWCTRCGGYSHDSGKTWRAPTHAAVSLQAVGIVPVPMLLHCPWCGHRHIDEGEFATKAHHTHACQNCGMCWRPCIVPTVGVQFLPGFKNVEKR